MFSCMHAISVAIFECHVTIYNNFLGSWHKVTHCDVLSVQLQINDNSYISS